ncbi:putative F-box protein [Vitis vinifera]|uniref:F-box protein n=1 Tax=Vitis vinifera TaxID=29760 RepID=A0A438DKK5_VITVI|nr:putative F-box protein [Vitis vinifera]
MKSCICSPPWEVLLLVAHYLDPKALAISSCVSRSWSISMSSDHLWQPICSAHFPSLCNLRAADPTVPYRRLYAIGYVSVKRRLRSPSKPRLSLDDVVFAIDVQCRDSGIVTIAKPASDLEPDPNGLFRFDMEVCEPPRMAKVLAGGWFSSELPAPVCCSGRVGSGLVADLRLGFCEAEDGRGGRVRVGKVGVGVLSVVSWRYVSVDDALRYLQHFLSPSHD